MFTIPSRIRGGAGIVCLLVAIIGCKTVWTYPSLLVMRDKVVDLRGNLVYRMSDYPKLPEEPLKHKYGKQVVISVNGDVSVCQLYRAFRYFNIEGYRCMLKLSDGSVMPFGVGYLVDYVYPPSLSDGLMLVSYASMGESRAIVPSELEADERLLVPFLMSLEQSGSVSDLTPSIGSKEGVKGFELICNAETTYQEIEDLLIQAFSLGYDISSVLGVDLSSLE